MFKLKHLLLFFFLTPLLICGAEWKELKQLKSYVKTSDIGKGRELLKKCLNDTLISRDPQLYSLATALEVKANDAENMKLYLHQSYDTAGFFNSVCNIFEYSLQEEKLLKETESKQSEKAQKKNRISLQRYYQNLYNGGVFFVKNKQWGAANRLLAMYIDVALVDYFGDKKIVNGTRLPRAAFWSMASSYENKEYDKVFRYQTLAEADSANFDYALQYEALAYSELCDTANYIISLKRGLKESAFSDYFFSRLADLLNESHKYLEAYELNDSLLALRPNNKLYLLAQTVVLFNQNQYDRCLDVADKLLNLDSNNIQASYYVGLCWFNKGVGYENTLSPNPTSAEYKKRTQEVNRMYQTAMPYLERYKDANPNDKEKWQAPLYKIYFSLNLVDKLNELEK